MSARTTDLVDFIKDIGTAHDAFQAKVGTALQDIRTTQAEIQEQLEEIETRASRPGKTIGNDREKADHVKAFCNWIRRPDDTSRKAELENIEQHLASKAAYGSIATPSAGGFAVPEDLLREMERFEKKLSPVRDLVKVVQIGSGDAKSVVNLRGATAGWVAETGSRSATLTSDLREIVYTGGELYAYPKVSEWLIDDAMFDVQAWLVEEVGESFAELLGDAVIRGDASNKPTGMLNDPPTSRDDFDSPVRDVDEYQYVNADDDRPFAVSGDGLISLVYKVNSMYRAGASWAMNSNTAAIVRKLKMTDRYLWTDSILVGQPSTLLGYPVAVWEQMDDVDVSGGGNATFPIAFGNFRRAYTLADRTDMRVLVDPVTEPGFRKFYVRRRVYGHPTNTNAVKFLRTAA